MRRWFTITPQQHLVGLIRSAISWTDCWKITMPTFGRTSVVRKTRSHWIDSRSFSEGPTKIEFDILVSSFGPIQDMDMVCRCFLSSMIRSHTFLLVLHDELLFSSTMAWWTSAVCRRSWRAFLVNTHARTIMATRYNLLQFQILIFTHDTYEQSSLAPISWWFNLVFITVKRMTGGEISNLHLIALRCISITVKARCNMNLKNFPVDVQICKFFIGSCKTNISKLIFPISNRMDRFQLPMPHQIFSTDGDWEIITVSILTRKFYFRNSIWFSILNTMKSPKLADVSSIAGRVSFRSVLFQATSRCCVSILSWRGTWVITFCKCTSPVQC